MAVLNVNAAKLKPEDFRRVEGWLRQPDNAADLKATILQLANLLELQNRYPEVIRLYPRFPGANRRRRTGAGRGV